MKTDLETYVKYVNKADIYPEWVYGCSWSKTLRIENDTLIYIMATDMPFPFHDRLLKVRATQTLTDTKYETFSTALDTDDRNGKYVVIPYFYSHWVVNVLDENTLEVFYEASTDPRGVIPSWLYDMAIDIGPYQTMLSLKEKLEK